MTETPLSRVERAERVAHVMDRAFRLPGTSIRVGLDSIVGLVPGVGDTLAVAPSLFILSEAYQIGLPKRRLARMAGNIGIDWAIGLVPLVGDIFDVGWKANSRNAAMMRDHITRHGKAGKDKGRTLSDAA
ncbi:hypothetical protein OB2597_02642 [Pseudooceanicola batsensis HTCC2597]|uniref:DUF4112 domain-containing protein n=1 Tax=Pseudooceanicola batsensis (strain ATCC BAA-863 / DSM 15984 / KCTC 12145 / HTCC2597) TaxID=252305 RepID=A3TXC2_PSEBH|nr:DUF4112 domain-containing protein [Pseudooceanicola batsensis]EAQ03482.1 hypothetical protein OB2597_02642 [Pseudooceanicola batsensis HTCC2597]